MAVRFRDKRDIYLLSSKAEAQVQQRDRVLRGGVVELYEKPRVLEDYSQKMGGVDLVDGYVARYRAARKSYKWYKKAGIFLMQRMVVNAYILRG